MSEETEIVYTGKNGIDVAMFVGGHGACELGYRCIDIYRHGKKILTLCPNQKLIKDGDLFRIEEPTGEGGKHSAERAKLISDIAEEADCKRKLS